MGHDSASAGTRPPADRLRRTIIWAFIIAVPWVPAAVALAMILSGNAGS